MENLQGEVTVRTGAASGIGWSVATRAVAEGPALTTDAPDAASVHHLRDSIRTQLDDIRPGRPPSGLVLA